MPVTHGSHLLSTPEVRLIRLLLFLIIFIATSTEAIATGLGLWQEEKDQIHDRADYGDAAPENRENDDTSSDDETSCGPRYFVGDHDALQGTWVSLCCAEGARPCGKLRRHRWVHVDLN